MTERPRHVLSRRFGEPGAARLKFQLQNARFCLPMALMVMILPFLIGLLAALFALRGQRLGAILAWAALVVVLLAWLQYHASDTLNVSL